MNKELVLRSIKGKMEWVVYKNFTYLGYTVPKGFKTDLASVPRALWSIFPPSGIYLEAAVVHDYLIVSREVPRATADKVFKRGLKDCGVSTMRAWMMFNGVRAYGRIVEGSKYHSG